MRSRSRAFLGGVALGAGLTYFLDAGRGAARRARLRRGAAALWRDLDGLREPSRGPGERFVTIGRGRRDDIPGLDGPSQRANRRLVERIPPATAFEVLAGGMLAAYGLSRRGQIASAMRTIGAGMVAKGIRKTDLGAVAGIGDRRRAVDIQKILHVAAPVETAFAVWSDWSNFPRFLSHVREVRDLGGGRTQWVVNGPAGAPVEWSAMLTQYVPNQVIAWRSEEGSVVRTSGMVRFEPTATGTQIALRIAYALPGGGAGDAVAALIGADPKRQIDDDLARLRALIERAAPRGNATLDIQQDPIEGT